MGQGWIRLHRKIQDHWLYKEKRKFSRFEAWIDLLMMANHKDNKFLLGNELIEVNRGQLVTSELKLMERWSWGKSKLRDFLKLLEEDGMIVRKSDRKKTVITICNYNEYQSFDFENRPQTDREQTNNRLLSDTNNNDKNDIYTAADIYNAREESIGGVPTTESAQLSDGSVGQIPGDSSQEDYERIKNLYMLLAGKGGFDVSPKDEMAINELLQSGINVDKAYVLVKECFDNYKPKHSRDKINSFSYCVPYILDKHYAEKEGAKVGKIQQHRGSTSSLERKDSITNGQIGWLFRKRNTV